MAILDYTEPSISPEVAVSLSEINEYSLRAKAMLTALGDYWTNYYRNLEPIATATTGSVAAVSKQYTYLLDMVKSSNILDIPIQQSDQFELLVINKSDIETVYDGDEVDYYFIPLKNIVDTQYLTTSLFESRIVLEKGVHFDVVIGEGYKMYVDLFGDDNITNYAYEVGEDSERHMLLWACDIALSSTVIYERYGRFLYKKSIDSEKYKWVVTALMRFYENAKTVRGIQDVLNIMYGIPYTRYANEVVKEIYYVDEKLQRITALTEEPYICIETDRACYYTYAFSDLIYKVGDVVPQFSLLADFHKVEDYVTNPGWWENCDFPATIADNADLLTPSEKNELMDKVLKYNTVHLNIGVSVDSYATYLSQVKHIFNIIESGFPVYLFPLVDTFVRARFIDKEDMDEIFHDFKTIFSFHSEYDWGQFLKFDGTIPYSMEPDPDSGSQAIYKDRHYNSENTYCNIGLANGIYTNVRVHDGTSTYNTKYKYYCNNDREFLNITKYKFRLEDIYVRNKKDITSDILYGSKVPSDGSFTFDSLSTSYEDEFLKVAIKEKNFTDHFGEASDTFGDIKLADKTEEFFGSCVFDGSVQYDIALKGGEDFTLNVIHCEI